MRVTFVGTRGEIERNTSAIILYHKPNRILIDLGRGNEMPNDITAAVITHAHPDHAFGFKSQQLTFPVYLNKFSNRLLSRPDYPFRRKVFWKQPFQIGNVKITPVPVRHSIKAPASGLIFEAGGRKIAYFPDVLELKDIEVLRGIDVYIGDGASLDRDIVRTANGSKVGHASVRTQLEWLRKAGVKRAIFTHFGRWAMQDNQTLRAVFSQLSAEFDMKVAEAFDGYRIRVGRVILLQRTLHGISMEPPHAANIIEGYETIIVSPKPAPESYIGKPVYLLQRNKLYGILILKPGERKNADDVRIHLRDDHGISDQEWFSWWGHTPEVWVYRFEIRKAYIPPKVLNITRSWPAALQSAEQLQQEAEGESPYALVRRYGDRLGRPIELKDVLRHWEKPIILKKGYITLTGGLTNSGKTDGDIDVLQAEAKEIISRDQPIIFRLGRSLPPDLAERLRRRFIGEYGGAFTSHIPVYDLVLVPSIDRRLVRMQRIEGIKDAEARRQASTALREDKVTAGQFVIPLKGYRAYYKFVEEAVAEIRTEYQQEDFPLLAQKKYDGAITEWLKQGSDITVRSDAGFNVTSRFPTLVGVAKRILPTDCTILCETEMWKDGEHQPREVVSGYLNAHTKPDDSNLVLNAFDIAYSDGDMHKLGYAERYKMLHRISFGQSTDERPKPGFNLTPSIMIASSEGLQSAMEKTASYIASEGTVLKSSQMTYELDGLTRKMLKWKKMAEVHAIVTYKHETKTPGVFTLYASVAIPTGWKVPNGVTQHLPDRGDFMFIGKTFNVAQKVEVGDIITLSYHTLNLYIREDGSKYITVYEPKFIDKSSHTRPDNAEEAIRVAHDKELLVTKRLQNFPQDDQPHESVVQTHYRKKSVHMELRIRVNNYLLGLTMLVERPGALNKDVTTVAEAKSIEQQWERYFKFRNIVQTEIEDPRKKIQVVWKSPEPLAWLNVERRVEPGEIGATKTGYGVFSIVDRPTVYFGAQKSYFKEFFIEGKLISGRWVIRLLRNPWGPKPQFVFMMWKPEDQTPYVITKRAVQKKWIPPLNVSALPPTIRSSIPTNFKYWNKNNITERLAIREALVNAISKGEVKIKGVKLQRPPEIQQPISVPAVLQHRWWRGQYVVRGGPTEESWELFIDFGKTQPLVHFVLRGDVTQTKETDGVYRPTRDRKWLDIKGIVDLKPGTTANPTQHTPAYLETIDRGTAEIVESGSEFMKVRFNMTNLKGLWTFTRLDPHQNLWTVKKVEAAP